VPPALALAAPTASAAVPVIVRPIAFITSGPTAADDV